MLVLLLGAVTLLLLGGSSPSRVVASLLRSRGSTLGLSADGDEVDTSALGHAQHGRAGGDYDSHEQRFSWDDPSLAGGGGEGGFDANADGKIDGDGGAAATPADGIGLDVLGGLSDASLERVFHSEDLTHGVHAPGSIASWRPDGSRLDELLAAHLHKSSDIFTLSSSSSSKSPSSARAREGIGQVFRDLRRSLEENLRYIEASFGFFDAKCNESIAKSRERVAALEQLQGLAASARNGTAASHDAAVRAYGERLHAEKQVQNEYVLVCHSRLVQHVQDVEQTRADLAAVARALQLLATGSDAQIQDFVDAERRKAAARRSGISSTDTGGHGTGSSDRSNGTSGGSSSSSSSSSPSAPALSPPWEKPEIHRQMALQLAAARERAAHLRTCVCRFHFFAHSCAIPVQY